MITILTRDEKITLLFEQDGAPPREDRGRDDRSVLRRPIDIEISESGCCDTVRDSLSATVRRAAGWQDRIV
jgi:hypothetical protein